MKRNSLVFMIILFLFIQIFLVFSFPKGLMQIMLPDRIFL